MGQLGELLKEARQDKGVSLEEIEEELRIRKNYLQALEEENFSVMPPKVYVKGFLRNYARYLGLDLEEVRALYYKGESVEKGKKPEFLGKSGQIVGAETYPHAFPMDRSLTQSRLLAFPFLVIALAILAFLLLSLWAFRQYFPLSAETGLETETATPVQPRPTFTPTLVITETPTLAGTPTPKIYTGVEVELVMLERAWLQVHVDGEKVFEGVFDEGTRITWDGKERVAVRCNNAGGVEVILNGQNLGPLGNRGQVVDREWTTKEVETTPEASTPAVATPDTPSPDTPAPTTTSTLPPADTPTASPETPQEETTSTPEG